MPLATLTLLQLHNNPSDLLSALQNDSTIHIILASTPQFHVIKPEKLDGEALTQTWDILLLLASAQSSNNNGGSPPNLSNKYSRHIKKSYTLHVGIPSRIINSYPSRNAKLLASASQANKRLTLSLDGAENAAKSSSQNLELSPALLAFAREFTTRNGPDQPVTMLNLLHFNPDGGKKSYAAYGQAFVDVAGKRGGDAKLVGNVVSVRQQDSAGADSRSGRGETEWWNEFSLVHYPSILAFCDMLAGEDYQDINRQHRLGALKDTVLLCTKEIDLETFKARL